MVGGSKTQGMFSNCYSVSIKELDDENVKEKTLKEHKTMHESKRLCPGLAVIKNNLYVFGGGKISASIPDIESVEVYNITTDQWRKLGDMPTPSMGACYVNFNNRYIYKYGGIG
mmetsp:Transcript_105812/g.147532  ORF Transcript_105812/g.147532 Transcript_105812/m.147532 type:complete len:114 (+) Transcript_105812:167-508(+)